MINRQAEIQVKQQRLRGLMAEKGLTGILLRKQPNFSWLTAGGLNMVGIATEMGVSSLLITMDGCYVIASNIEAPRMMQEEGLALLGFELLEYGWMTDAEAELVRVVTGALSRVGCDCAYAECPNMEGDIKKLRYSLTASEVERYLFLGEELSKAVEKVALSLCPGDRECEIAGLIARELWQKRIDPVGFNIAADERASCYRHPIPTRMAAKQKLIISVNARYKGLIVSATRMVCFGRPADPLLKQFEDNLVIECRMIAATKPGVSIAVPFEAGMAAYQELGYPNEWTRHHQGGGGGYYARDYRATGQSKEIVADQQAVFWNPSIAGTKTEDGFIVTGDGPQMITGPQIFPRKEYMINGIRLLRPDLLILN